MTFLWQAVGALPGAPTWLADLTPFRARRARARTAVRAGAAAVIIGIGLAAALATLAVFRRHDLLGT